jgi:excisionase family DNA binding protein
MAALPTFISTAEAAHQLEVSEARLRRMIEAGRIKAANISGEIVVSEASVNKYHKKQQPISQPTGIRKEDLLEYRKFNYLKGDAIWLSEAARKYGIPHQTILKWIQRGFISESGKSGNRLMLNEQDVAYCAEIYNSHHGRGKWLFNVDGTPYVPRAEKIPVPA